ncbi:hypothetical protein Tco_0719555 [Tanacetum coccineum]
MTSSNNLHGLLLQIHSGTRLKLPLPLKGHPGHLTVVAEYFFNNDLEYLKSTNSKRKYTTSITKTKPPRYELVGIEDMILKQWSTTKVGYNRDDECGIKHWEPKLQHKLFHLDGEVIVDLAVALRMFTRSLIIKKRVEDVQLGVVYEDLCLRKRLMRADELYKFSDGTLKKRRSGIMVDLIDKQMLKRQILRNLERLVGGRELEIDYRLMQRTV